MYSYDGISWSDSVRGIVFSNVVETEGAYGASGNGTPMWVAAGNDSSGTDNGHIMYSYNGISWSDSVGGTSFGNYGNGIAYGTSRGRNSDVGGCWLWTVR